MDKYYQTLELKSNASKEDVKKAHRKLSKKYHPDMEGGDETKFKEIQEAYEILSGKKKPKQEARGNPFGGFEEFFRGGNPFGQGRVKGKNIAIRVDITLEEAFQGTRKDISFDKTEPCGTCAGEGGTEPVVCNQCNGQGFQQFRHGNQTMMTMCNNCAGKGSIFSKHCGTCGGRGNISGQQTLRVTIPRGVEDGRNLVLKGAGNGIKGGKNGDVICVINVLEHQEYYREGIHLQRDIQVPIIDMLLGSDIEFNTLDGDVKINIPKNCQTDKIFRLKNKGMIHTSGVRGDLLVTIKPKIPETLNEEEIEILQNLKNKPNFKEIT